MIIIMENINREQEKNRSEWTHTFHSHFFKYNEALLEKNYEERNQNLHNTQLRDGHCLISFRLLSPYTAKL